MSILLFVAIGLAAGIMSGLFGIGGGIIIVPALILLAKMPAPMATGTSLGVLVLPVVSLGAWTYYRNGLLNPKVSLLIACGLLLGSWLGATFAQGLAPETLRRKFAIIMVVVAARIWFSS
jgi:uncharacterized membrane protein YfcA